MNYLFLFFIVTNLFSCQLPLDIQKKIANFILCQKEPNIVPLQKHVDNYEGLVFPSTGSFVFIKSMSGQTESTEYLLSLEQNNTVLPNVQLWFNYHTFRIDDDLKKVQNSLTNVSGIAARNRVFFDKNDTFFLIATQRSENNFKITIRTIVNAENIVIQYFCQSFYSPCLHYNPDGIELSFFAQENNCFYLNRRKFFYHFFKKFYTINEKKTPIESCFSDVKKHEYIGKDTFVVLMSSKKLFFMVDDEKLIVKKQSFVYHDEIKKEYGVISFSACQEERTLNGRARFIAALVENEIEKKVLLIDLLNPDLKAHTIYTCDKNEPYDRISFFGDVISLWVDDPNIPHALQIRLPNKFIDDYKRSLLFLGIFKQPDKDIIKSFENLNTDNSSVIKNHDEDNKYLKVLLSKKEYNYPVRLFSKDGFFKIAKFFCFGALFLCISMAIMAKAKNFF